MKNIKIKLHQFRCSHQHRGFQLIREVLGVQEDHVFREIQVFLVFHDLLFVLWDLRGRVHLCYLLVRANLQFLGILVVL